MAMFLPMAFGTNSNDAQLPAPGAIEPISSSISILAEVSQVDGEPLPHGFVADIDSPGEDN